MPVSFALASCDICCPVVAVVSKTEVKIGSRNRYMEMKSRPPAVAIAFMSIGFDTVYAGFKQDTKQNHLEPSGSEEQDDIRIMMAYHVE
ncbi:uncharacterized [Tachysurus ichikawai]